MQINELIANHNKVLAAIIRAKHNKAEGKINPWPKMNQSNSHAIMSSEKEAVKMNVQIVHGILRDKKLRPYTFTSVINRNRKEKHHLMTLDPYGDQSQELDIFQGKSHLRTELDLSKWIKVDR